MLKFFLRRRVKQTQNVEPTTIDLQPLIIENNQQEDNNQVEPTPEEQNLETTVVKTRLHHDVAKAIAQPFVARVLQEGLALATSKLYILPLWHEFGSFKAYLAHQMNTVVREHPSSPQPRRPSRPRRRSVSQRTQKLMQPRKPPIPVQSRRKRVLKNKKTTKTPKQPVEKVINGPPQVSRQAAAQDAFLQQYEDVFMPSNQSLMVFLPQR